MICSRSVPLVSTVAVPLLEGRTSNPGRGRLFGSPRLTRSAIGRWL